MKHLSEDWVKEWCQENGWTDLVVESNNQYWAFPPGGYIPVPIPSDTLRLIKSQKGLSPDEKIWSIAAVVVALAGVALSYGFSCPMPLVFAFAFEAIAMAKLEVEEV